MMARTAVMKVRKLRPECRTGWPDPRRRIQGAFDPEQESDRRPFGVGTPRFGGCMSGSDHGVKTRFLGPKIG